MPVATDGAKDRASLVGPIKRMARGTRKKAATKRGAMGTPRRKVARRRAAKKTRR